MQSKYSPTKGKGAPYHHSQPKGQHPKMGSHSNNLKCPKCGGLDVRRSLRRGFIDRVLSLINLYPYRCSNYRCEHRFYRWGR